MDEPHIRWMIRKDAIAVLKIEQESFPNPWSAVELYNALMKRNCIAMVAEWDGEIVGYVIYELNSDSMEIVNLAVKPDYRGLDIGGMLVTHITQKLTLDKRTACHIVVRETNLGAQLFLKKMGFMAIKILANFYSETTEDSYLFTYSLKESTLCFFSRSVAS